MSNTAKNEVNIFDFDYTIYDGDCSLDFYYFCIQKNMMLLRYLPFQSLHFLLFKLHLEKRDNFKEHFFIFLKGINSVDILLNEFWAKNYRKAEGWYLEKKSSKDIIISASPEFLLKPAADRLGVRLLIATKMDANSGHIDGKNCRGDEKVRRLHEALPGCTVANAYSDTLIDKPILLLAKNAYFVRKQTISKLDIK